MVALYMNTVNCIFVYNFNKKPNAFFKIFYNIYCRTFSLLCDRMTIKWGKSIFLCLPITEGCILNNKALNSKNNIYNEILDKIQYCEWTPGMLISETKLSELFGISRTPIREALSALAQNGFVDIIPQRGSYVSLIDLKRIRDILFLRYHLELPILEELIQKNLTLPLSVEKLVLLMNFEISNENWKEAVNIDYMIHEELVKLSGHNHIWNIIKAELPHYTRFRFFEPYHNEFKGAVPRSLSEHSALLEAIQLGDIDKLHDAMKSHYDYTFELRKEYNINRINLHPDYFIPDQLNSFINNTFS